MPIAFSDSWASAWGDALNGSDQYRTAAATWEGTIVVAAVATPGDHPLAAAFLDVWHGDCRAARAATEADLATADYLIEGSPAAWRELFASRLAPIMALMTGQILLSRGSLTALLPYASAAKELIALAATIGSEFPSEWEV